VWLTRVCGSPPTYLPLALYPSSYITLTVTPTAPLLLLLSSSSTAVQLSPDVSAIESIPDPVLCATSSQCFAGQNVLSTLLTPGVGHTLILSRTDAEDATTSTSTLPLTLTLLPAVTTPPTAPLIPTTVSFNDASPGPTTPRFLNIPVPASIEFLTITAQPSSLDQDITLSINPPTASHYDPTDSSSSPPLSTSSTSLLTLSASSLTPGGGIYPLTVTTSGMYNLLITYSLTPIYLEPGVPHRDRNDQGRYRYYKFRDSREGTR